MLGTLFNVLTVVVGSTIGLLIRNKLPQRYVIIVFQALGLFTLFLGMQMAFKTEGNLLLMVFSLVIGSILGEALNLERRFQNFGESLKKRFTKGEGNEKFTEGLVTSFLLFCIGPMAILGAVQEGLGLSSELLYTKSIMDGFSSTALAAAMGIGVLFSAIPLLLFQGGISLLADLLEPYLTESIINELSAVGGLMLIALGINILEIKQLKVLNMLPSLVVIVLLHLIF